MLKVSGQYKIICKGKEYALAIPEEHLLEGSNDYAIIIELSTLNYTLGVSARNIEGIISSGEVYTQHGTDPDIVLPKQVRRWENVKLNKNQIV